MGSVVSVVGHTWDLLCLRSGAGTRGTCCLRGGAQVGPVVSVDGAHVGSVVSVVGHTWDLLCPWWGTRGICCVCACGERTRDQLYRTNVVKLENNVNRTVAPSSDYFLFRDSLDAGVRIKYG